MQDDINSFADLTNDHHWIYVDEERAAAGPFGGTIGHGLFTLSLWPGFMEDLMAFVGLAHSLNYGYGKVRFPQPRPLCPQLCMLATVSAVDARGTGSAQVTTTQIFEAEGIEKPICVAESIGYFTEHNADI